MATDQQTAGLELRDRHRSRHRRAARGQRPRRSTTRSTTPSASGRSATTYTQLNQYRVVMEVKPAAPGTPGLAGAALRPLADRRPGAAVGAHHREPAPTAAVHQPPGPVPVGHALVQPGARRRRSATRSTRSRRAEREIGLPASVHGGFPGTAQAFQRVARAASRCLIVLALLAVYIVLGVLYESYVHPITILSTLPSAGVGALLALLLIGTEFSIIALIGDHPAHRHREEERDHDDRLRHRGRARRGARRRSEAIYKACLLRFRPILMTTLAALFGGAAAGARTRRGLGAAAAARHHHRRRAALLAAADALHDAGGVPRARQAVAQAEPPGRRRRRHAAGAVGTSCAPCRPFATSGRIPSFW